MLYQQVFKTREGAEKRVRFERVHVKDGERGNVNYRFFVVRCDEQGRPDGEAFNSGSKYTYRIEKTLRDHATDPRILS